MSALHELQFRHVKPEDLDRCFEIEQAGFSREEAATREKIEHRIRTYPEGFLVAENQTQIAGFVNSGACHTVALSDEDFKELLGHDPDGPHIVVMSVVVHPEYQGKGFAGALVKHFIEQMRAMSKEDIYLICQTELIGFYEKYGFNYLAPSESDHGGRAWHDMRLDLCTR
ncbi:GNAT family acetyltransferase [Oleiphilus sp. HI0071]|uniref:GNAT family N-acetyltransferase n=2 Tax=Oleiphilus sp. HI0080 TaxID=1822255 RepID=UPI0007C37A80|nr:GNAT family N-acetyltransferase [Oleiphilus sp. HI0080]KZY62359.1 GNAT family acetyltransferase [Oleiphilus sp. HI0065]KZY81725.1 GNAT family acetyltransferase [Oleiphilus sp. HI0071]KZZ00344.1 GNAT family acetyltransferase [Oleiphilus sp. HI0073]KZZ48212.1 GNAT family acetyltransferase [Oleiphilus sp. HI0122]KZZ00889.1 GNAT family acetyltransferase [Oleiphilus sp. HI0073]